MRRLAVAVNLCLLRVMKLTAVKVNRIFQCHSNFDQLFESMLYRVFNGAR
jgi:hypothetical protein